MPPAQSASVRLVTLVVQKFGGTSVGDTDRIRAVADHIALTRRQGKDVAVVVSAMGKATDGLINQATEVSKIRPGREMDMLLTTGERVTTALLCMALADRGVAAESFTGSQAGIITDVNHGKAKILEIKADRIRDALQRSTVPVIAGFQGVSTARNVTTLGRGGSDTTAVALAAGLDADECEIYTDVSGVFSADPRLVPRARKLSTVSYDEMLEISATGGRVLALRSVEFARKYNVHLHVRSSFTWEPGTWVTEEENMEQAVVSAVTHDTSEVKVTIASVPDEPGIAARVFQTLASENVNVDMIVQNVSQNGATDISFTIPADDLDKALATLSPIAAEIGIEPPTADRTVARVSVVGAGMKSHPGVAAKMFQTLADRGVNIEMISTSSIRISCVINADNVERAVEALHGAFELELQQ